MTTFFKAVLFPAMLIVLFSFISTPVHAEPQLKLKVKVELTNICKDVKGVVVVCEGFGKADMFNAGVVIGSTRSTALNNLNWKNFNQTLLIKMKDGHDVTDIASIFCYLEGSYKGVVKHFSLIAFDDPSCANANPSNFFVKYEQNISWDK